MGKSKKTGRTRLDRFYHLAKEQGYRSRAAFKLIQLDRKYRFLSSSTSLLDLCAAPGGWMQVAAKNMPVGSLIVGVDLVPIKPIRGALSLQGDITTPKCASAIKGVLKEKGYGMIDVVLHDGSPNVGGAWAKEASSQTALVLDALKLATKVLAPKGTFITKVFRSRDYNSLLYAFHQLFERVEVTKPVASRNTSAEIYVICSKYKAPAKIDPRLLDFRHLFQEISEPQKVVDVLKGSKQKRHRDGYEENNYTLTKESQAFDFIWAEKPLDMLGTITSISFSSPESSQIKDHPLTTEEIRLLCEDLRVLGKQEFKQLLKWRLKVRQAWSSDKETGSTDTKGTEQPTLLESEETLLNEMGELKQLMELKKKKAKKALAKRRQKAKARSATGMQVDVMEDKYMDAELFNLSSIKAKKDLDQVENPSDEDPETMEDDILNGRATLSREVEENSDIDSDAERQRYDAELEEYLDRAYHRYQAVKGSAKKRKRAKLIDGEKGSELWEEDEEQDVTDKGIKEENLDNEAMEENPLLVQFEEAKLSKEQITKQWFSQDVFAGLEDFQENSDEEGHQAEGKEEADPLANKPVPIVKPTTTDAKKQELPTNAHVEIVPKEANAIGDNEFEIVPAESSSSSDVSSDEDYDSDAKAETLAYAKKMLRKKNREEIIDAAYNRYTFDDQNLPDWFADDERRHNQLQKPVTKEEILAMKAQFRAINARPVKKIAEAKARKKRRAMKRMEQVRKKATAIADQSDISNLSKNRMMERLYKKAANADRTKKRELVVAKKGVHVRGGKGKVVVDRRMKKDSRSKGTKLQGNTKGKKGSGKKPKPSRNPRKSGFKGSKRNT